MSKSFLERARAHSAKPKKYTIEPGFDVYIRSLSMQRFRELRDMFKASEVAVTEQAEKAKASAEKAKAEGRVEVVKEESEMSAEQMTAVATLITETICEEDGSAAVSSVDEAKELINTLSISLMSGIVKQVMLANGGGQSNDDSFRG